MPLISVIVPCYNAAPYLEACVASLCAQTLGDIEVWIVDDGSTDGSGALADACIARDARVRVLRQANAGVAAARNAGLEAAQGEWISFVDADDTLKADALATLYAAIERTPEADIVSARHRERYADGRCRVFGPGKRCRRREQVLARLIEGDSVYNSMCNKLYRRNLLERWHIRAQEGLRIGEDALFNLEAYARAGNTVHLPAVTYEYRIHGGSAMVSISRAEHYARHLPWLIGMRVTLERLNLREAFFRPYCHSHTLRLYKSRGLGGALYAFNAEVRPAALEGVDPGKLRWMIRPMYAAVRAGLYPPMYCLIFPSLRARDFFKRVGRWAMYFVRRPFRQQPRGGSPCA
jgi:glycosyltransferase involved in cell wall biosynthesis